MGASAWRYVFLSFRAVVFLAEWVPKGAAESIVGFCNATGGAFPKVGQILSTRADILPEKLRLELSTLQDRGKPIRSKDLRRVLKTEGFESAEANPVACATIAQVHRWRRENGGRVYALKIMRPGVRNRLESDCRVIKFFGKFVARSRKMASIPVNIALEEASEALIRQADFGAEAENHRRLYEIFRGSNGVLVPAIHPDLSTPNILVTEFIEGLRRVDDPTISDSRARELLTTGVRALYRMIFQAGFIHCDLHPANMLVAPDGRLVILDAGFMVDVDDETRRSFAEFFLAIAFRDGAAAAKIVRETAARLPANLDVEAFDADISDLIRRTGGLKANEFQVTGFVAELFAIQTRHGISGTSKFTLIILSLLVFEGVAKQRFPDLDFQQEAVPFVIEALAGRK